MASERKRARLARAHCIEPLEPRRLFAANVLVHHGDAANDGADLAETVLTPSNVNASDFGKQFSTSVDGVVTAQPLYVQDVDITRGPAVGVHSVAYVATEHDSLYAIDANTGAVLWHDTFLNTTDPTALTATTGVTPQPASEVGDNAGPELGIWSTPAIDLSRGELFLNAATQEVRGSDLHFVQRVWAVRLSDGTPVVAPAVMGDTISNKPRLDFTGYTYVAGPIVQGSGNNKTPTVYPNTDGWASAPGGATTPVIAFNALVQGGRPGLTLMGGNVYLAFSAHVDQSPYYGWIIGYSESTLALTAAFVTTPTYEGIVTNSTAYTAQGGVWSAGSALATDGTSLYVPTSPGAFNVAPSNFNAAGFPIDHDYADSLLKLQVDPASSPSSQNGNGWGLKVADYFTPSNAYELGQKNLDLGSGGATLLPDTITDAAGDPLLVMGGKESRLYVLDTDNLGKFNPAYPATSTADPRSYDRVVNEYAANGIDGTAQGMFDAPVYLNGTIYVGQSYAAGLAFSATALASGQPVAPLRSTPAAGYLGPTYTASADGTANALLWETDFTHSDLVAYDATNLAAPLYTSKMISGDAFAGAVKFGVLTVANGMVYVAGTADTFVGYGLRSSYVLSSAVYSSAPTNLVAAVSDSTDVHLSWTDHSSLATEYRIDRSTNGATWTTLVYLSAGATTYDDATAASGTAFQYRVAAILGPNVAAVSVTTGPSVSGAVTDDSKPIAGGTIYDDANNNLKFDPGELSTTTAANGTYTLIGVPVGASIVRQILPAGYTQQSPTNGYGIHITTQSTSTLDGENFTDAAVPTGATISGTVTAAGQPVLNETIYLDANNNSKLDTGELSTQTNSNGGYTFASVPAGGYIVRQILQSGYAQTSPSNGYGIHITVGSSQTLIGQNFTDTAPAAPPVGSLLTGAVIGTAGSYKNDGNTITNVFDGKLSTFFDAPAANGNWVGLDLGVAAVITQISYAPRSGWAGRMVGGIFQGSDTADFSAGVVNLSTITTNPAAGVFIVVAVNNSTAFRYVRYLSPAGSYGNLAELRFVGTTDPLNATLTTALGVAQTQVQKTITAIGASDQFPQYTNADGTWSWVNAGAWTAGFLPALLWQLSDATGNTADAAEATQLTLAVNAASQNETSDNGFRMLLTDLPLLQQDPGDASIITALLTAAAAKTTTYNAAVGGFEAWRTSTSGNPLANFNVLMDMIMDLPLQIWASQHGGPVSDYTQAVQGAITEENNLVRPDGSSAQFAYFNSATGQFIDNETYEGYSATSTWSRGQAWGIYGFTKMAALTGRADFLTTAEKMANWYLAHLPTDDVPYWDFDAPNIPNAPRDTSAAAIAASGLLQLSSLIAATDPTDAATYRAAAGRTLASLASATYLVDPSKAAEGDGVLLHGALNVPANPSLSDSSVIFGDYYFVEAINEYLAGN